MTFQPSHVPRVSVPLPFLGIVPAMPCSFLSWVTPSRSVRRRWPPLAFRLIAFPVQCFTTCPGWGLSLSYHLFLDPVGFLSPMPPPICYPARRWRQVLFFFPFPSPLCVFVVSCLLVVSNRPRGLALFPSWGIQCTPGAFAVFVGRFVLFGFVQVVGVSCLASTQYHVGVSCATHNHKIHGVIYANYCINQ